MQPEYACFISYRNSRQGHGRLNEFAEALRIEITKAVDAYLPDSSIQDADGHNVFLDQVIFKDFAFNAEQLGHGLCKSIVWIVLYSRNYLSGSLWCASELDGIVRLEQARLASTGQSENPDFGFIVPILLASDEAELPPVLRKNKRHLLDFNDFFLRPNFTQADDFIDKLRTLLDNIGRVQQVILDKDADICASCNDFAIEDVTQEGGRERIQEFVKELKAKRPPQPIN